GYAANPAPTDSPNATTTFQVTVLDPASTTTSSSTTPSSTSSTTSSTSPTSTSTTSTTMPTTTTTTTMPTPPPPPPPDGTDHFTDDDGHVFEADINAVATAGFTRGCNPPVNDMFCPEDLVTRGQMAAFLVRALNL